MPAPQSASRADAKRRPARDVIDAVLANMRQNLEPLKYSVLVPSRYLIYLHPSEYARLEGVVPVLREETIRALTEELELRNRPSTFGRYAARVFGARPRIQPAGAEWQVEFLADPDGDLAEGDILVDSELSMPAAPELGAGTRTRRITTVRTGQHTSTKAHVMVQPGAMTTARVFARLVYDDNAGHHAHDVVNDSVTIGRGGVAYPVDVRIVSSVDVSREHARIRRDAQSGNFFLVDLSSLGTTVNGRHVPRGYEDTNGVKKENGSETLLPDHARIGLADTVFLDFRVER
jgi:FHA domain